MRTLCAILLGLGAASCLTAAGVPGVRSSKCAKCHEGGTTMRAFGLMSRDAPLNGGKHGAGVLPGEPGGTQGIGEGGRDHNPEGFTAFPAGAGVKPGFSYRVTGELGYRAVQNPTTLYGFHATILHLLGLDHKRLTFYRNGLQRRLTDVHGEVLRPILA